MSEVNLINGDETIEGERIGREVTSGGSESPKP